MAQVFTRKDPVPRDPKETMHRRLSIPAAILIAAFPSACEGGSPHGPEAPEHAQFSHSGSSQYAYTHAGDVTTDPETRNGGPNVGKGSHEVVMGLNRKGDSLDIPGVAEQFSAGSACFPVPAQFAGVLSPDKKNPSRVTGTYYFDGFASNGSTSIKYVLKLSGTVTSGTFPPSPGQTSVVTWDGTGAASMGTEGRAQSACTGTRNAIGSVSVTGGS